MAIGNPINLTSNVEGKNISVIATAGQTQFTVTGGYRINQISVFRNGVRLVDGRDFTAADGATVTLLSAATVADVLEFQVFDDFRVSDALNVNSGGTVNGNVTVTGILSTTNLSIGSSISLDATSGIVTAVQFVGDLTGTATTATSASGLSGTPDITVNNIVAAAATFSGVLTYEDVTNIDSLGIVTARTGVDITANGLVVNAGISTFGADLSIADKIIHSGDTNTAIRFPSNDKFTVETAGVQRLEVDSNGDLGLVGIATATGLVVVAGSGGYAGHTGIITAVTFDGNVSGGASGDFTIEDKIVHSGDTNTAIRFPQADTFTVETGGTEAYRVDSSRRILLGHTSSRAIGHSSGNGKLQIEGTDLGTSELSIVRNSNNNGAAHLFIGKSRGSSVGDSTVVQSDDTLGIIGFAGADGTDLITRAAQITAAVDGSPGSNDMPGRLTFETTADGASTPTERLRITSNGRALLGHTANINNHLQQITTSNGAALGLLNYQATDDGPEVTFIKSRNGTKGSHTVVNNGDFLGRIFFRGSDGDSYERGVEIAAQVDGTPGDGDMPGRLLISTTADGASTPTERLRITNDGTVRIVADNQKLTLGAGNDFELYHDGTDNVIATDGANIRIGTTGETFAKFVNNGAAELYHDNSKTFETTSTGALVRRPSGDVSLSIGDTTNSDGHLVLTAKSSSIELHGRSNHPINILFNTVQKASIGVDGTISDNIGPLRRLGTNTKSSDYTLVAGDAGKAIIRNGGNVTVPNGIFSAGDMVTIINNASSDMTVTQGSSLTLYNSGDSSTGNVTQADRSASTIVFASSSVAYIAGGQLS